MFPVNYLTAKAETKRINLLVFTRNRRLYSAKCFRMERLTKDVVHEQITKSVCSLVLAGKIENIYLSLSCKIVCESEDHLTWAQS